MVTVTGFHRHSCLFGAIGLNEKQLFRQYDRFNEDNFYKYLKQMHYKFPRCYLSSATSVNHSENIALYVNTRASTFRIDIFRMGWSHASN